MQGVEGKEQTPSCTRQKEEIKLYKPLTTQLQGHQWKCSRRRKKPIFPNAVNRLNKQGDINTQTESVLSVDIKFRYRRSSLNFLKIINLLWNGNKSLPLCCFCFMDWDMRFSAAPAELLPIWRSGENQIRFAAVIGRRLNSLLSADTGYIITEGMLTSHRPTWAAAPSAKPPRRELSGY